MRKHGIRIFLLLVIFIGTIIFFFSKAVITNTTDGTLKETIGQMEQAGLPVLYMRVGNKEVNRLYGYMGNVSADIIRDTVTPILADDKYIIAVIDEYQNKVKKITYELKSVNAERATDSGTISALSKEDNYKTAKINIKSELETGKEYILKITAVTDTGKKINYFTRIKRGNDYRPNEKLDFVMDFNEAILDKNKAEDIKMYLEPSSAMNNSTLSYVNINSSLDLVSFGNMKPSVEGSIVPTIKEINNSTASIELKYMISSKSGKSRQYYYVSEFYRVRWTEMRMYLLNYERTTEEVFDSDMMGLTRGELKLGVTDDKNIELIQSANSKKLCFVRERQLWYYDYDTNSCTKVFSFLQNEMDYVRDTYDRHNIKILNMDDMGNIDFLVYGYMNRGPYEGRVAIVLYKYNNEENRIIEQAYIPVNKSYEFLKEDVESLFYFNGDTRVYMKLDGVIYSYDTMTKELIEVVSNISDDSYMVSDGNEMLIFQNTSDLYNSSEITLVRFALNHNSTIEAGKKDRIRPIGFIGTDFVYGLAKAEDVGESKEGGIVFPMYKLVIVNENNEQVKTYQKKGIYVMSTEIDDNAIQLNRATKESSSEENVYKAISGDFIATMPPVNSNGIVTAIRYSEKFLNELYISFPLNITITKLPVKRESAFTTFELSRQVKIDNKSEIPKKYYVYSYGEMYKSYKNPADAIRMADSRVGVVTTGSHQLIWERGGRELRAALSNIDIIKVGDASNSVSACIKMILDYEGFNVDIKTLNKSNEPIKNILDKYLKNESLVLSGCTLDEVLYFVSQRSVVMAKLNNNTWVLIVAYDEYNITIINPQTGVISKMGLNDSGAAFEAMGNLFISYIK